MKYNPQKIEKKWQSVWKSKKTFAAKDDSKKPKWYTLVEFPYPSGAGMHVGHVRSYTALDVVSRKRRMEGYNVLYPMGWDAFGLPTENYAIKTGVAPQVATKKNTDNFRKQLQSLGYSFDWNREVNTTDPDYYRWTQWIFQQFFKKGLAYKSKMAINWCPKDKIGLANEEVVNGKCERCGTAVEQRQKEQWMLKITAYADKLLEGLKDVNYLPEIKAQQENWIGRSEGAEIDFPLVSSIIPKPLPSVIPKPRDLVSDSDTTSGVMDKVRVFTTRPDTLFGATYLVLAPEHELLTSGTLQIANSEEVAAYIAQTKLKSDLDRTSDGKEKTGVELKGVKVINPATKEEVPVWIGDYVLATYGTGAIMAVPAHDERDFAFAKKYQLPIKEAIEPLVDDASGKDAVRPGLPVKKRDCVICIVKHWNEDKYLCLRWKKMPWGTFVVGGVETGEDEMTAAAREIIEESGYTSAKFIRRIDGAVRSRFYHELKNENRDGRYQGLYFELVNDSRQLLDEKEAAIHEMLWVNRAEVEKFLTSEDFKIVWRRLFGAFPYSGEGLLVNSGKFDGMRSDEAKKAITEFVGGKTTVKYKLRDWVFSRQRYWGEPIPLVNCEKCGWVLVPEKDLPIKLPKVAKYEPTDTGESPLSLMPKWVNTKCPECKGPAKRETDTMPNWAGSSWYFLRYCDPANSRQFADSRKLSYWQPVDWYNGGMEHVTLHLLYSRFWNLFLYDLGLVPTKEPYKKRTAHGMILASDGKKMSKSVGNVVNPDDLVKEFGGDALRLYELFIGPFDQAVQWDPRGILGTARFLEKVWRVGQQIANSKLQIAETDSKLSSLLNKTIQKVGADIEAANFNTAVSAMMIFVNEVTSSPSVILGPSADGTRDPSPNLSVADWQKFLSILSPFAPHIAEELWVIAKGKGLLCEQVWPKVDEASIAESTYELIIQVNSKVRATFDVKKGTSQPEVEKIVSEIPEMQKWLTAPVKRVIFVKDRLINFIV